MRSLFCSYLFIAICTLSRRAFFSSEKVRFSYFFGPHIKQTMVRLSKISFDHRHQCCFDIIFGDRVELKKQIEKTRWMSIFTAAVHRKFNINRQFLFHIFICFRLDISKKSIQIFVFFWWVKCHCCHHTCLICLYLNMIRDCFQQELNRIVNFRRLQTPRPYLLYKNVNIYSTSHLMLMLNFFLSSQQCYRLLNLKL